MKHKHRRGYPWGVLYLFCSYVSRSWALFFSMMFNHFLFFLLCTHDCATAFTDVRFVLLFGETFFCVCVFCATRRFVLSVPGVRVKAIGCPHHRHRCTYFDTGQQCCRHACYAEKNKTYRGRLFRVQRKVVAFVR